MQRPLQPQQQQAPAAAYASLADTYSGSAAAAAAVGAAGTGGMTAARGVIEQQQQQQQQQQVSLQALEGFLSHLDAGPTAHRWAVGFCEVLFSWGGGVERGGVSLSCGTPHVGVACLLFTRVLLRTGML
jgi:hypothetical protein